MCALGRCREAGTLPASTLARRLRLVPSRVEPLGSRTSADAGRGELSIDERTGATGVLVAFDGLPFASWSENARLPPNPETTRPVERAVLVFEPAGTERSSFGTVDVELAERPPISARAGDRNPSLGGTKPGLPMRLGTFSAMTDRPMIIDVTELVRRWTRERRREVTFEIAATPHRGARLAFALHRADAGSPRLDVYLAPTEAEQAAARTPPTSNEPTDAPLATTPSAPDSHEEESE